MSFYVVISVLKQRKDLYVGISGCIRIIQVFAFYKQNFVDMKNNPTGNDRAVNSVKLSIILRLLRCGRGWDG